MQNIDMHECTVTRSSWLMLGVVSPMHTSWLTKFGDGILIALKLEIRSGAGGEVGGGFVYCDGIGGGRNVDV